MLRNGRSCGAKKCCEFFHITYILYFKNNCQQIFKYFNAVHHLTLIHVQTLKY